MEIRDSDSHQYAVGHRNGTGSDQLYGVKNCRPQEAKGIRRDSGALFCLNPNGPGDQSLLNHEWCSSKATETAKAAKRSSFDFPRLLDAGLPIFIKTSDITIKK